MKLLSTCLIILFAFTYTSAQVFEKHDAISLPLTFLSGAAYGYSQVLAFHYYEFDRVHPGANQQYWNPDLSWENKYKNGDPEQGPAFFLSTTLLVPFTDGYHANTGASRVLMFGGVIPLFAWKPDNHWQIIGQFIKLSVAYIAGFHTVYTLIY